MTARENTKKNLIFQLTSKSQSKKTYLNSRKFLLTMQLNSQPLFTQCNYLRAYTMFSILFPFLTFPSLCTLWDFYLQCSFSLQARNSILALYVFLFKNSLIIASFPAFHIPTAFSAYNLASAFLTKI